MKTEYKNTNVKFNMADPMQAKAWKYLQEHKGTDSYAKIIAWAISEANRVNDGCSQERRIKFNQHHVPGFRS